MTPRSIGRTPWGVLGILCGLLGHAVGDEPAGWTQWRGPDRASRVHDANWPETLSGPALERVWVQPLDTGYPGPVLSPDRVFVAETRAHKEEVVRALKRDTGEEIWQASWPGSLAVPFFAAANGSWIRSTPAYDGQSLFVAGMRDVLVCLDAADGRIRWRVDFTERYETPLPAFGFVCSPLVDGDHLYVQAGASVCKLDKHTGQTLWRSLEDEGGMYGSAFSSPVIATLAGVRQLVVQTRTHLAGVDLDDGAELWQHPVEAFRGMNILTPLVHGDAIFTSAYGGQSLLVDITRDGEDWQVRQRWRNSAQGYMSSPVLVDGHIYLHLRNTRVCCIRWEDGTTQWTSSDRFGKYWSMIAGGDKILALDERGGLVLLRANPEEFELLDRRRVSENSTWAHLAIEGPNLFVRDLEGVSAFRWQTP